MGRLIESTLTDPALPGYGEVHRLVTTLLDPRVASALELVCADHERWEIELLIDETDPHQRLSERPLRRHKPLGVIQELDGLLIAHDAIRLLMHEAAVQHELEPDRLSFVHALEVIRDAIAEFQMVPTEQGVNPLSALIGGYCCRWQASQTTPSLQPASGEAEDVQMAAQAAGTQ